MGLLERFEDSLDRLVNGAFARAFKAEVQPVELAAALQREIDDRAAVVDRDRTVVPNTFQIELSEHDYMRLSVHKDTLEAELSALVKDYAVQQRYSLLGPVSIVIDRDDELDTGIFRVRSESRAPSTPSVEPGQAQLMVGSIAYPLVRAVTRVGRGSDCDVRVDDAGVSRTHFEIVLGRPPVVRDLGSTNGTLVDGQPVGEAPLHDGASIVVGTTTLVFRSG